MKYRYILPISLSLLMTAPFSLWAEQQGQTHSTPNAANVPDLEPKPAPVEQSESLQISSLADGKVHVEFSYQDQANQQQNFSFEGSKAEVQQQIQQLKNLPEPKKQTLLQALNGNGAAVFTSQLGGFDPFNDPFFKNDPWMNQVMQQFFQGGSAWSMPMPPAIGQQTPKQHAPIPPHTRQKQHPETKPSEPTKVWL